MGLTLDDVRELLSAREMRTPEECRRVATLLAKRVEELDRRLGELAAFRERLESARRRCANADARACPVVLSLEAVARPGGARSGRGAR